MKLWLQAGGPAVIGLMLLGAGVAHAHSPVCNCLDNGDNTITCEGGFSDGSSASGVKMRVLSADGAVIKEGSMDKNSEFTFAKPEVAYKVVFDGGEGHSIEIDVKKIVQ